MPRAAPRDPIYRGRRFSADVIELCVRWYITYRLSYRDLSAMIAERGVAVTHTSIMRWVLRYVPEYEKRWARFARPVGRSWRMDETAVSIRGEPHYLYRAVDGDGKSVHSLLCSDSTTVPKKGFLRWWPLHVPDAERREVLALQVSLRWQGRRRSRWVSIQM